MIVKEYLSEPLPVLHHHTLNHCQLTHCSQLISSHIKATSMGQSTSTDEASSMDQLTIVDEANHILFRLLRSGGIHEAKTWLHIDRDIGKQDIIRFLLEKFPIVNAQDYYDRCPLHYLVDSDESPSYVELIKWLIDKGADTNMQDNCGETAMHLAVQKRKTALIRLLLDKGANVNIQDSEGQSPLHCLVGYAESPSDVVVAKWLIDKGADLNMQDENGRTVLHLAITKGKKTIIRLLLDSGAGVDLQDIYGQSPLHYIADCPNGLTLPCYITKMLTSRSVNVNIQDNNGKTPVHMAVDYHYTEYLSILLDWGGSFIVEDNYGRTPLYYLCRLHVNKNLVLNVVMRYVQRMECAGLSYDMECDDSYDRDIISDDSYISDDSDDSDYQTNLFQELERMKQEKCGWSCIHDVFAEYRDPMYTINRELQAAIESPELDKKYVIYGELLKSTFTQAKRRFVLLNRAADCFELEVYLPVEVRRKILSYLDCRDMKAVVTCYDQAQV